LKIQAFINITKKGGCSLFFKNSTSLLIYNEDTGKDNRKKINKAGYVKMSKKVKIIVAEDNRNLCPDSPGVYPEG
jgi:phenolic acid decarboxylase